MNNLLLYVAKKVSSLCPETRCFALKRALYRLAGVKIGKNVRITSSATIIGASDLSIGDNTWIGHQALIVCSAPIKIGKNCGIAPRVYIGTGTHEIDRETPGILGKGISMPITIEDGCWLCVNSTILYGTTIADHSIIAPGAVVKGDVPSYELWGGCLAKKIKNL